MPCNPAETLPFYFRAYDPPYMSGDIDPGIAATVTPTPGTPYPGKVSINNDGAAAGGGGPNDPPAASVRLWAVQPGTAPSSFPPPTDASVAIAACSGGSSRATAATTYLAPNWGASSHYCLIAKVKNGVQGPALDFTPAWDLNNTGDPAAPYLRIAQRNVFIIPGGGAAGTPLALKAQFAFAITNPSLRQLKTRVIARPIDPGDDKWMARIQADPQLRPLLRLGKVHPPMANAGIAVGLERVHRRITLRPIANRIADALHVDVRNVDAALPRPGELTHVGPLTVDQFESIMVRGPKPDQAVDLRENENQQGIAVIQAPEGAAPGSMFGLDIRHELVARSKAGNPRLIGGLVVFLRLPHPEDPKS